MKTLLFDVNVLIALVDQEHDANGRVRTWLGANAIRLWATCPITENGLVRIMSHSSYPNRLTIEVAIRRLNALKDDRDHRFWSDKISLTDEVLFEPAAITSHSHLADVYLLALATAQGGNFLTLDTRLNTAAVRDGAEHCVIVR